MSLIDDLLASYHQPGAGSSAPGSLPAEPPVAMLTCMDPRMDPAAIAAALGESAAAHVRNAGGRVTDDALRSLVVATRLKDARAIIVVHHPDCAMMSFTNEAMQQRVAAETGRDTSALDFLTFDDLDGSVRDDLAHLRSSLLFPEGVELEGFVYDVATGRLHPVAEPAARDNLPRTAERGSSTSALAYRAGRALGSVRRRSR
jgi:carbonic anhydrase